MGFAVEALDFEHACVWPPKDDCRQADGQNQHMDTKTVLLATRRSKPAHGHPNCSAGNQTVKTSTGTPKLCCWQPDGQNQHMDTQTVLQVTRRSKPAQVHLNCAAGNQTVKTSTWTPKLFCWQPDGQNQHRYT